MRTLQPSYLCVFWRRQQLDDLLWNLCFDAVVAVHLTLRLCHADCDLHHACTVEQVISSLTEVNIRNRPIGDTVYMWDAPKAANTAALLRPGLLTTVFRGGGAQVYQVFCPFLSRS